MWTRGGIYTGRAGSTSRSSGGRSGSGGSLRSSSGSFSSSPSSRNHSSSSRSHSSSDRMGNERSPVWYSAMQTKTPRREAAPPPVYRASSPPPSPIYPSSRQKEVQPPRREVPLVYTKPAPQRAAGATLSAEHDFTYHQKRRHYEKEIKELQRRQRNCLRMVVIAIILTLTAFVIKGITNRSFEKAELKGTESVGFIKDDGFLKGSYRTKEALEEFYKETGIPLFLYTIANYPENSSTCDAYAEELYDVLFTDENHALLVYYDNVDWWSWVAGNAVASRMTDKTFNSLVDAFYFYWEQDITNDEVFAKGLTSFIRDFTGKNLLKAGKVWSAVLWVVAVGALFYGGIFYLSDTRKIKDKREALEHLEAERVLSIPLEKFADSGLADLKEKYQ